MEDLKKEIRRILLGYIAYRDNCIVAARESVKMRMLGTFNGTTMARVFGVSTVSRRYRVAEDQEMQETVSKSERKKNRKNGDTKKKQLARKLFEEGDSALQNMGRRVLLDSEPDRIATFYAPILYNPAVLLLDFNEEEDAVDVTVVTARTMMSRLNAAHAFWKWSRHISLEIEQVQPPKPEKEETDAATEETVEQETKDAPLTKEEKKALKAKKKELAAAKAKAKKKQKLEAEMAKLQAELDEQTAVLSAKTDEKSGEPEETEE